MYIDGIGSPGVAMQANLSSWIDTRRGKEGGRKGREGGGGGGKKLLYSSRREGFE